MGGRGPGDARPDLGILDSITRRVMLDGVAARPRVRPRHLGSGRLDDAQEAMALSTVREIQPVSAIGLRRFYEGPVTADLARLFHQRVY